MGPVRECLVMAKPAGPLCNLRCDYCYYVGKTELLRNVAGAMDAALLERYIAGRFAASPGPVTHFEWHGGEPTLLGLGYFETIVQLQKKHCPPGRKVSNGLQTNGMMINSAWADFLAREGFSVGLSLDGSEGMHDRYRRTPGGEPSHARVLEAFALLAERKVFTNILCVIHAANVGDPDRLYDWFKSIGVTYLQFLPLVARAGAAIMTGGTPPVAGASAGAGRASTGTGAASESADSGVTTINAGGTTTKARAAPACAGETATRVTPETAAPEEIGRFLCRIFDRWIAADVGRLVIQTFDEALRPVHGIPHALCIHRETCGDVAVLERDGSFYACDHFVDPEHLIGSLRERSIADLGSDPAMIAFGEAKRSSLPRYCRECEFLSFCNGGCPKDRFASTPDGEPGLNYLCPAYRMFFSHAKPGLERLSAHIRAGRRLREFRP